MITKPHWFRVIDIWNGGHVGPATAHEYALTGKRLTYIKSFELDWQSKTMVRDVLCKPLKTKALKDKPRLDYDDLLIGGEEREDV